MTVKDDVLAAMRADPAKNWVISDLASAVSASSRDVYDAFTELFREGLIRYIRPRDPLSQETTRYSLTKKGRGEA